MPTYLDPVNGLSQSEALALAAIAAPIDLVKLMTYELWHPSMDEPVRIVDDSENLVATLEEDAPRNGGETVTFVATRVTLTRPKQSDQGGAPQVALSIDNVAGLITDQLRVARLSDDPAIRDALWEVIERIYTNQDATAPHELPVFKATLKRVTTGGATATFVASQRESGSFSVPAITFTPEAYPGLV